MEPKILAQHSGCDSRHEEFHETRGRHSHVGAPSQHRHAMIHVDHEKRWPRAAPSHLVRETSSTMPHSSIANRSRLSILEGSTTGSAASTSGGTGTSSSPRATGLASGSTPTATPWPFPTWTSSPPNLLLGFSKLLTSFAGTGLGESLDRLGRDAARDAATEAPRLESRRIGNRTE